MTGRLRLLRSPDRPEDGPQLLILLFGFYRALLLAALDDVGVHVSSVISLCSEASEEDERGEDDANSQTAGERAPAAWLEALLRLLHHLLLVSQKQTGNWPES